MDSLKTDYFKWMDAPVKACIIGITAALGSFVAARYGCGLTKRSSVLISSVAYVILMNYYFPLHKALVSKSINTHVYWYISLFLILIIGFITTSLALTDVDPAMYAKQRPSSNISGKK